jgi:hypothetical protein
MRVPTNARLAGKCLRLRGHGDNYRRGARHLPVAFNHAAIPRDESEAPSQHHTDEKALNDNAPAEQPAATVTD